VGDPEENPLELSAFLSVLLLLQDHIAIDVAILCQTLSFASLAAATLICCTPRPPYAQPALEWMAHKVMFGVVC
jgi:hypothetical protein